VSNAINAAAADLASKGLRANQFGDALVYISDVVVALAAQNPGWAAEQIRAEIAASSREVGFSRADIPAIYDAKKLAASLLVVAGRERHFVEVL
jgi:hypothetical protein